MEACPAASAGASLSPSPIIRTLWPCAFRASRRAILPSGRTPPCTVSIPVAAAAAPAAAAGRPTGARPHSRRACSSATTAPASDRRASSKWNDTGASPSRRYQSVAGSPVAAMPTQAALPSRSSPCAAARNEPRSGDLLDGAAAHQREAASLRRLDQRLRQRVAAVERRDTPRAAGRSLVDHVRIGLARLAQRERAGLVEHDRVDLGQPLERVGRLDDDARAEQAAGRRHLHRRHGQRQRARAGDDEHRDRERQRLLPAGTREHPAEERDRAEDVHGRRIEARGAVGEPHVAPARLLGGVHQPGDLGNQRVLVGRGRLDDLDGGRSVDGAGIDSRARRRASRGIVSPVIRLSSISLAPATTRPSTGMRSPAATRTRMPGTSSRARRRAGAAVVADDGGGQSP